LENVVYAWGMTTQFLKPSELDSRLRYPSGRSLRLARRGLIPHIKLPDGEIRFDPDAVDRWLREHTRATESEATR
jgi:hypothetical protein